MKVRESVHVCVLRTTYLFGKLPKLAYTRIFFGNSLGVNIIILKYIIAFAATFYSQSNYLFCGHFATRYKRNANCDLSSICRLDILCLTWHIRVNTSTG